MTGDPTKFVRLQVTPHFEYLTFQVYYVLNKLESILSL